MTYLSLIIYLNTTKIFYLIDSKNLSGKLYATTTWLLNSDPVNGIENVLLDFFKKVPTVTFSVTTDSVPYF